MKVFGNVVAQFIWPAGRHATGATAIVLKPKSNRKLHALFILKEVQNEDYAEK